MNLRAPYNPLEKRHLGISVAEAMLAQAPQSLGEIAPFTGAGIYALYYSGDFPAYARMAAINRSQGPSVPIYVGKAIPEGGRKGKAPPVELTSGRATRALSRRLMEHAESIRSTQLSIADFACRHLVVDDIWIPLGESLLITRFSPLWNLLLDGFGNHDPGAGRYNGLVPKWDVLHPGRSWASRCRARSETDRQIAAEVLAWLEQAPSLVRSRYEVREAEAAYASRPADPDAPISPARPGRT
jgi:Eco29kI restriction endonuclease